MMNGDVYTRYVPSITFDLPIDSNCDGEGDGNFVEDNADNNLFNGPIYILATIIKILFHQQWKQK